MMWVLAVILLVGAALLFSFTQPQSAPEMTKALVVAFITAGAVFGLSKTGDAAPRATDSLRSGAAVFILVVGSIVTFSMFTSPALGVMFALVVLGGCGFLMWQTLNRRPGEGRQPLTTQSLTQHDANQSVIETLTEGWRLSFQQDLLDVKLQVAQRIAHLEAIHYGASVLPSAATADIAANLGAAKREIPRAD